jgi:hypothetical protein
LGDIITLMVLEQVAINYYIFDSTFDWREETWCFERPTKNGEYGNEGVSELREDDSQKIQTSGYMTCD